MKQKREQRRRANLSPATKKVNAKQEKEGLKIFCDVKKCLACRACEVACAVEHSLNKTLVEAIKETPLPKKRRRVSDSFGKTLSVGCQHCKDAACVAACMSGALYKDKDGTTKQDKD
ncbi:MAG: hypothetical protein HY982_03060, partial [Candidatus Magasanikbacteria bacterium]|nr:hypothetical protein [Candidatus Magasanikbacteria bacterium]